MLPSKPLGRSNVFVPGPHGGLTTVHGGGNSPMQNVFDMIRTAPTPGQLAQYPGAGLVLTRHDGLNWAFNGRLPGSGYFAGDPYLHAFQHIQLAGETFTRMILGFADAPCPYVRPFPGCGIGSVMILRLRSCLPAGAGHRGADRPGSRHRRPRRAPLKVEATRPDARSHATYLVAPPASLGRGFKRRHADHDQRLRPAPSPSRPSTATR